MDIIRFKEITITLLLTIICQICLAQENRVNIEFAGNHGYFGVNYGKRIITVNKHSLWVEIGLGGSRITDLDKKFNPDYSIPLLAQYQFNINPKHQIFAATGTTLQSYVDVSNDLKLEREFNYYWTNNIGYNYFYRSNISVGLYAVLQIKNNVNPWFGIKINRLW